MIGEARAAARLNHPGITTVYDVVEHDGAPVIVMEFVTGRSLAAVLRERTRLPVPRVAEIGIQVLDALAEAHAAGVVHRDLKPDNIMVTDRRAVITDFGIAAIADAAIGAGGPTGLTTTGGRLGTPAYASPEQWDGEPATAASDLWSFGATLYAAVEGHLPFHGADLWTLRQAVCESDPAPFRHAGALAPILTALLAKQPDARATLAAAAAELRAHRTQSPSPRLPAGRKPRRLGWKLLPGRRTAPAATTYAVQEPPTQVMRTDPVEELERAARQRLHSQVEMHLGLLNTIAAAPPSDADLLRGLKNLQDTHIHRVGRILDDESHKLHRLRDREDARSWQAMEPYAAHHGAWLAAHRNALTALDATLGLSEALLTGASPRARLLVAVDAFRSHMRDLQSD